NLENTLQRFLQVERRGERLARLEQGRQLAYLAGMRFGRLLPAGNRARRHECPRSKSGSSRRQRFVTRTHEIWADSCDFRSDVSRVSPTFLSHTPYLLDKLVGPPRVLPQLVPHRMPGSNGAGSLDHVLTAVPHIPRATRRKP